MNHAIQIVCLTLYSFNMLHYLIHNQCLIEIYKLKYLEFSMIILDSFIGSK